LEAPYNTIQNEFIGHRLVQAKNRNHAREATVTGSDQHTCCRKVRV